VKDTDDKIMQRKIKFFILSILAGALIFCGSVLLSVESSTLSKNEMSMLYCFAPNNINLSSFVNECIKYNVEKVFLMENKKNGMSLVVQREKFYLFYLLTRGGGVAKYSKLVNVKKLMEGGGVYMIYDKSKGKSVAMDYVSVWIKDEEKESKDPSL
jgi:hypothetical protein